MVTTWLFYLALSFALFSIGYGWGCYNTSKEIEPYLDTIIAYEERPRAMFNAGSKKKPKWLQIAWTADTNLSGYIEVVYEIAPGVKGSRVVARKDLHKRVLSHEQYEMDQVDRLLEYDDPYQVDAPNV